MASFDDVLLELWSSRHDRAHSIFKSYYDDTQWRELVSAHGLLVLFNPSHTAKKRADPSPSDSHPSAGAFDRSRFNFNKAKLREHVMALDFGDGTWHPVLVNVSPIGNAHVILVPHISSELPQLLQPNTRELLYLAICFSCISSRPGKLIFAQVQIVNLLHQTFESCLTA